MRRAAQEIKDKRELEKLLKEQVICRLGMRDGDGVYVVPVDYGYEEGCLYVHTAVEGKKLDCLREDKRVCFEVDELRKTMTGDIACKWSSMYQSVIGQGEVEFAASDEEKRRGLDVIMKQHGFEGEPEYSDAHLKGTVVMKVVIKEMTGKRSRVWVD